MKKLLEDAPEATPVQRVYTTDEAAKVLRQKPATLRASLCRRGHWLGIRPIKLPNNQLRWPADKVDRLITPARNSDGLADDDKNPRVSICQDIKAGDSSRLRVGEIRHLTGAAQGRGVMSTPLGNKIPRLAEQACTCHGAGTCWTCLQWQRRELERLARRRLLRPSPQSDGGIK